MPNPAPAPVSTSAIVNPVTVWARQQGVANATVTARATVATTVTDKASANATVT